MLLCTALQSSLQEVLLRCWRLCCGPGAYCLPRHLPQKQQGRQGQRQGGSLHWGCAMRCLCTASTACNGSAFALGGILRIQTCCSTPPCIISAHSTLCANALKCCLLGRVFSEIALVHLCRPAHPCRLVRPSTFLPRWCRLQSLRLPPARLEVSIAANLGEGRCSGVLARSKGENADRRDKLQIQGRKYKTNYGAQHKHKLGQQGDCKYIVHSSSRPWPSCCDCLNCAAAAQVPECFVL